MFMRASALAGSESLGAVWGHRSWIYKTDVGGLCPPSTGKFMKLSSQLLLGLEPYL